MDGIRAHDVGTVRPADTLGDVLVLFKAAREWSIDVDEQLRAQGVQPMGATLGMPVAQLDALIVIVEREQAAMQEAEVALRSAERALVSARRACRAGIACAVVGGLLSLVNVIVWWF